MDDYSALAQRIALSVPTVRGSLILSRDGLVLGAFPAADEGLAKTAWLRFTALGESERSFVEFVDQVWAFVKRGPYSAFTVAEAGTRPGVLVDQMEQVLLAAEDGRTKRDALRVPDASSAPSGKPRTSLHPPGGKTLPDAPVTAAEAPKPSEVLKSAEATKAGEATRAAETPKPTKAAEASPKADEPSTDSPDQSGSSALKREPQKLFSAQPEERGDEEGSEVDRVLLAKEFSGLLQPDTSDDEGSA